MERNEALERKKRDIMHNLSSLPRKILQIYGRENIAEFILHELGKQDNFNLKKAAYIIDNPDFDCLKGVAGYCLPEAYKSDKDIWQEPDAFTNYMKKSGFNNKIRGFNRSSCVKKGKSDQDIVNEVAADLGFEHPSFYAWKLKHDNHGILLYEKNDDESCDCDYLLDGLCIIGFCPIF